MQIFGELVESLLLLITSEASQPHANCIQQPEIISIPLVHTYHMQLITAMLAMHIKSP